MFRHKKHRIKRAIGLVFAIATIGAIVGCKHAPPEAKIEKISEKIASKLDFTEEQKALLAKITDDLKKDFAEERSLHQKNFGEIDQLLAADTLNTARIKELYLERQARMNSKLDVYLEKIAALHKSLTAKQKEEIKEKMDKFKDHWE